MPNLVRIHDLVPLCAGRSEVKLEDLIKDTDPGWKTDGLTSGDPQAVQHALEQAAARAASQSRPQLDQPPQPAEPGNLESSPGTSNARPAADEHGRSSSSTPNGSRTQSIDHSMDSHFGYIQQVSTVEELEQLMEKIRQVLYEASAGAWHQIFLVQGGWPVCMQHVLT